MANRECRLVAPYHSTSGYAKMSRAILRSLIRAGYKVEAVESDYLITTIGYTDGRQAQEKTLPKPVIPLPDIQVVDLNRALATTVSEDAPTILIQLPGNLSVWPQFGNGPMIGWTMTESDNLCRYWNHGLRCVDTAIAPSTYVGETFRRCVPGTPSTVVPLPVDDRLWLPDEFKEFTGNDCPEFLFLSIFATSERKKWRQMMLAFAEEFKGMSKEVGLVCKPTVAQPVQQMADWCREMGAWVATDTMQRNDWMLGGLYRACNVYVQPASEGFGLPFVEAALCGLPSIALSLSGSADVVDEETGYVVPSFMEPLIGHMPQVYDRKTHNFASFDIDELRKTMRRAYEEEKANAIAKKPSVKGMAARKRALERFTPDAVAPQLTEAIEYGIKIWNFNKGMQKPPEKPAWATVAGAWGDVFCCCGNIKEILADKELESIGVIYYGRDAKIADWLRMQPWVREVIAIVQPDVDEMTRVFGYLCQCKPHHGRVMWQQMLKENNIEIEGTITYTQLCLAEKRSPKYWTGAVLPKASVDWAASITSKIEGPFLLLNPLSIASNKMKDHWRFWSEAMVWLLENTRVPVVMVGENPIPGFEAYRYLVDASGQSKSMCDVLALAELSSGIISTSNNLAHYSTICEKKSVIVAARTLGTDTFYHRWNEAPSIEMVEFVDNMQIFENAVRKQFGQYLVPQVMVDSPICEPGRVTV